MRYMRCITGVALLVSTVWAVPASAANKEQLQMMADIRMLQEQAQQLQILIGSLSEALQAVNARLEQQSDANRRAFADQKLGADNLANDLRIVREKMDDNSVRVGSLTQEVDALRQSVQHLATLPPPVAVPPVTDPDAPPPDPDAAPAPAAVPPPPPPAVAAGASPQRLYDSAWADYTAGQFGLAIQGFESFIKSFPRSEQADDAQVYIGNSHLQAGDYDKAVEAYEMAIRTYPTGNLIPDAWYKKGLAYLDLKQPDKAAEAFEFVAKTYPESSAAFLARQQIAQTRKP
ncbi:MAG: tetratricopeptide repeat protein [Vicinamibacterales bacterium]